MIELCLTNSQFSTTKYKSQFNSFKTLMESKHINIDSEDSIECDATIEYTTDQSSDSDKNNTDVILPNLCEFRNYSFGVVAYYSDSLYFCCPTTNNSKLYF